MSDGNRSHRYAIIEAVLFGLLILCTFTVCAYLIGETLGVQTGRNEVSAREHYERVKQTQLEACTGLQAIDLAKCVEKAAEAAQGQSESRQDLYAQRDMVKWAAWLLLVTGLTFLLSVAGLWALLRTIRQGQEANEIARDVGQAQVRAYVSGVGARLAYFKKSWQAVCDVQNFGQSPASDISWNARLSLYAKEIKDFETADANIDKEMAILKFDLSAGDKTTLGVLPIELPLDGNWENHLAAGKSIFAELLAVIAYTDVFGNRITVRQSFCGNIYRSLNQGELVALVRFAKGSPLTVGE